jgi:LacI family transcriptional regulator
MQTRPPLRSAQSPPVTAPLATGEAARLRDVAERAGVSVSTVSRALSGDSRISTPTRELVQEVATSMGYVPDMVARSLSLRRTSTVGLIVEDLRNPFYADLARGVEEVLTAAGYSYFLAHSHGDTARQRVVAERLVERRVDALLVTVPYAPEVLKLRRVPVVTFDRIAGQVHATTDHVAGAKLAVSHLVEQGYERIGLLYGRPDYLPVAARITGYRDALKLAGRHASGSLEVRCADLSFEAADEGARRLVDAGADAIFAINDVMAAGALGAVVKTGRRVPDDVGVIGYDDTPIAAWPFLNLSSVAQSTAEMGMAAARLALEMIDGKHPDSVLLEPRLVVRGSSTRKGPRSGRLEPIA